jgi:drug/metabolite transporter (DMT)-like permease
MIMILFLYMLLASTFTLGKSVMAYIQPMLFIGIRMTIAGSLLLAYIYYWRRKDWRWDPKDFYLYLQITLFHIYFAFIFDFLALQHINSAKACLIYNLTPFLTAFYAYFLFSERLTKKQWAGLSIGMIGFIPLLLSSEPTEGPTLFLISISEIFMLISVISSTYGWILMKQFVKTKNYSPLMINGIAMLSGGILSFISSLIFEGMPHLRVIKQPAIAEGSWGFLQSPILVIAMYTALLIIIANFIFYNLYGYLLRRYSATFLSFAGFTCPLFAALFGWLWLGERVNYWFFVTIIIVLGGLYLFYQDEIVGEKEV